MNNRGTEIRGRRPPAADLPAATIFQPFRLGNVKYCAWGMARVIPVIDLFGLGTGATGHVPARCLLGGALPSAATA